MLLPRENVITGIVGVCLFASSSRAAKQCYRLDGTKAGNDMRPCNPEAEESACCALNKARPDVCTLSGGLCLAQDEGYTGMMYANGCTDPSGRHRNCPQLCRGQVGSPVFAYNILQCNPGGVYCCRAATDTENCCNKKTLQVNQDLGTFSLPETKTTTYTVSETALPTSTVVCDTASSNSTLSSECPKNNTALVGGAVGGVLGAALLAALSIIALLCKGRAKDSQHASRYFAIPGKGSTAQHPPQELPGNLTHEMRG